MNNSNETHFYKFCSNIQQLKDKLNKIDFNCPQRYRNIPYKEKLCNEGLSETNLQKTIRNAQSKTPIFQTNCPDKENISFYRNSKNTNNNLRDNPIGNFHELEIGTNKYFLKKKLIKQIDHGEIPIELSIDLHNLDLNQAYKTLINQINSAFQEYKRLILLITGVGYNSNKSEAINFESTFNKRLIKNNILNWVNNNHDLLSKIYYINFAHPKHGGQGALYIYLR